MRLHRIPVLMLVPFVAGGAFFGDLLERVFGPAEPAYKAGDKISGKTKGYTLTIPDDTWLPLPEGRRAVDADLELSGQNGEAILVVFASCDGATLDDIVSYRRSEVGAQLANLEIVEDRRFESDELRPDFDRHAIPGVEMVGRRTYVWVSAAVDGRLDVEVIVNVLGEESRGRASRPRPSSRVWKFWGKTRDALPLADRPLRRLSAPCRPTRKSSSSNMAARRSISSPGPRLRRNSTMRASPPPPSASRSSRQPARWSPNSLVGEEVHLRSDGTIETRSTRIRYFLARAAAQQYGNMSEWVDAAFDKLAIEQAYTLMPDGRRLPVEPSAVDIRADSQDDIFDDNFEVILPYPGVEPHAMAVVVTRSIEDSRALPIPWSRAFRPEWFVPIEKFDLRFTWDAGVEAPAWKSDTDRLQVGRACDRMPSGEAARPPEWRERRLLRCRLDDRHRAEGDHGRRSPAAYRPISSRRSSSPIPTSSNSSRRCAPRPRIGKKSSPSCSAS